MFWWHGKQLRDPTNPSCTVPVALWRLPADRTFAIPWICQDASPKQETKPATARSAPRWRLADRQRGGGLWPLIDGSPFSATNCKPANEQRKRHLEPSAGLARGSQISTAAQIRAITPHAGTRILERSNLNMSAYNRATQGIYPTISCYERSMSKKTLDMH